MSDFTDLLEEGFAEMAGQAGSTLRFNGLTATVVASNALESRELRDAGLWEEGARIVEMLRTDFTRLKLIDRAHLELDGRRMQLFTIEQDAADPCVRLHLKPAHDK